MLNRTKTRFLEEKYFPDTSNYPIIQNLGFFLTESAKKANISISMELPVGVRLTKIEFLNKPLLMLGLFCGIY
jgi:hypothetical protein